MCVCRQGLIATSATIGAVAGTLIVGKVADLIGRKRTILIGALFSLIGSFMGATAHTVNSLVWGRALSGVAFGFYSTVVNIHLAECASPRARGAWLTTPQFTVSSGIALSYLYAVVVLLYGRGFRTMLGASGILAAVVFVFVAAMPESPRWLARSGRHEQARSVLAELRGGHTQEVESEFKELSGAAPPPAPVCGCKNVRHPDSVSVWGGEEGDRGVRASILAMQSLWLVLECADLRRESSLCDPLGSKGSRLVLGRWDLNPATLTLNPKPEIFYKGPPLFTDSGMRACWEDLSTRRSLFVCIVLQAMQQLCGINAIIYFTPQACPPTPLQTRAITCLMPALNFSTPAGTLCPPRGELFQKNRLFDASRLLAELTAGPFRGWRWRCFRGVDTSPKGAPRLKRPPRIVRLLCPQDPVTSIPPSPTVCPQSQTSEVRRAEARGVRRAILVAIHLMDRVGRRGLLLSVIPLLSLSLASLAASLSFPGSFPLRPHAAVASLALYGIFFVLCLGPIPNMVTCELLPTEVR